MVPRRPIAPAVLLALAAGIAPGPARADEAENYRRLQGMPRERRLALAENLERFDKLEPAERAAIRKLDDQVAGKDPVDQARYRSVLRRYHLWVNGLAEDQRQALRAAETAEARFALARKFRIQEAQGGAPGPRVAGIRTGDFGIVGPHEAAHLLKVWNKLPPAKRAEVAKQPERGRLFAAIRAEAKAMNVRFEPFPAADEGTYAARLDGDGDFKKLLGPMARRPDAAPRKGEAGPSRDIPPYPEFLYFEEHRPRPVAAKDLERFASAGPPWLLAMTDPLSPDDARAYLTILYRLLYPHPAEMPAEPKPAPAPAGPATPSPASKKATNAGPH